MARSRVPCPSPQECRPRRRQHSSRTGCSKSPSRKVRGRVSKRSRSVCKARPARGGAASPRAVPESYRTLATPTIAGGEGIMSRFSQPQHPWRPWCGWRCGVWLGLLLFLTVSATAHAFLADGDAANALRAPTPREGEDPPVIFAQARAWPAYGAPFPDAVLRQAVETALRPEAPWDQVTAAITAFDLYHDRPWVTEVMRPYVVCHAASILVGSVLKVKMDCDRWHTEPSFDNVRQQGVAHDFYRG